MKVKIRMNIHGIFCMKSATMVEKQIEAEVMETGPSTAEQKPAQSNSQEQQESPASDSVGKESGKEAPDVPEQSKEEASKRGGSDQSEMTPDQKVEKESAQGEGGIAEEQQMENSMDVSDNSAHPCTM